MKPAILIPAAGASSRMGKRDKLLEPVDGVPLLRRIVDLCLPHGPVVVTLPAQDHPRAASLPDGARIVVVSDWETGMSASLRAGVAAIAPDRDILIQPADMPEMTSDDIAQVIAARETAPDALIWQAADADEHPGHPVLFHNSLRAGFANLTGDAGARAIVAENRARRHLVPLPGRHALIDLDTPEDWAAWRKSRT